MNYFQDLGEQRWCVINIGVSEKELMQCEHQLFEHLFRSN